jgi:asparagine synthase (glutamine-hydrolysing)
MCGIVGGIGPSAPKKSLLQSQLNSLKHRGPDDTGIFLENGISLGMCRLAIVEVRDGTQPATDAKEQIRIVWNGEIYNYRELRKELEDIGIHSRGASESEVLINLYLKYGLDFVKKLNGMFAIAIFDARDMSLHLIRDRVGEKPLWVSVARDKTLFFASEVRALLQTQSDFSLRPDMISEVMQFGYINFPNSAFLEINQLAPATVLTWRNGVITHWNYWKLEFGRKVEVTYNEALERTKELINEAVSRRLISERPIGSFLSGGYDSTIVTAYMVKAMKEQVNTFTIGFENPEFNESNHASQIANYFKTNHHVEILKPDPEAVIQEISRILDQPFADSSILPTYLLGKFARENVIVALGGDGGDEVFGGYDRYLAAPILQKLNPVMIPSSYVINQIGGRSFQGSRKVKRLRSQLTPMTSLADRYSSILSLAQPLDLRRLINPEYFSTTASKVFIDEFQSGDVSNLDRMLRSDFDSYLPGDLLVKADIGSMANSLELRSPFLDVNLIEWGISLPSEYKLKGFSTKRILKDVARSLVPPELIDRPKMGFGIPRAEWLRGSMKTMLLDVLTDHTARNRGWFNPKEVTRAIELHMSGNDQDNVLWPMLMLELWAKNWLDSK